MRTDLDRQALILLCAPTSLGGGSAPSFGPAAWHGLQRVLVDRRLSPGQLLGMSGTELEASAGFTTDQAHRVSRLLGRGGPVAIEVERLASRGIWITVIGDETYPLRLVETLGDQAPPLLFGVGSAAVAAQGGLAMVGSRDAGDEAIAYTETVAGSAVRGGMTIVSGAARGVDAVAMTSALEHGGSAVGILADGLERRIREPQIRTWLAHDRLCLLTPYGSNTGFSVGAAMGRNKLIYGLSPFALVIAATRGKGGTWAGATEALKNGWSTVFVRQDSDQATRDGLESLGAVPFAGAALDVITADVMESLATLQASGPHAVGEARGEEVLAPTQATLFGEPEGLPKPKRARKKSVKRRAG